MSNKLLINIVIANLLWSFIPIVVSELFLEVSIIMVIFLRFLISGAFLFLLALILIIYNNIENFKYVKLLKINSFIIQRNYNNAK